MTSSDNHEPEWADLETLVVTIVAEAAAMKDAHTDQHDAKVSYSAVFCSDDAEYSGFVHLATRAGILANDTPTGPVFVVAGVPTVAGVLRIIKIRKPDPTRPERGDADFALVDYAAFKARYIESPGFALIERSDFEMIELVDPAYRVRAYFSHPPVEEHGGIREALKATGSP